MGLTSQPTKTDASLGRVKADAYPATDLDTQVPAAELEEIKTYVIDVCAEVGDHVGTAGDLNTRVDAAETNIATNTGNVSTNTGNITTNANAISAIETAPASNVATGTPVANGRANAAGVATTVSASDHVHDSGAVTVATKTAAYTLTDADDILLIDTTAAAINLTLIASAAARFWTIKKTTVDLNGITLVRPGGTGNIEGSAADYLLDGSDSGIRGSWTVVWDGSAWWVL